MSSVSKYSSLQAYNMVLYRGALHPEFFAIESRKRIEHGDYEFEAWMFRGGHAARFEFAKSAVTEILTEEPERLPDRGLIATLPCAGERDHDEKIAERIAFITSIQTETLSDHLYLSTYNELFEHGRNGDGLMSVWTDEQGKPNLSLIDLQRYADEVHIQSYHLRSDCGLVLRSQSIFQEVHKKK